MNHLQRRRAAHKAAGEADSGAVAPKTTAAAGVDTSAPVKKAPAARKTAAKKPATKKKARR